jgi:tetratricopeptide (TPR) repeat protein
MLAGYTAPDHRSHVIRFQTDQRLTARVFLARILWLQGFPDQAMRTCRDNVEDARAADHALSLCYALALGACPGALFVGDQAAAEHYVSMLLDHATRHGLGLWLAWGRSFEGILLFRRGNTVEGLRLLRAGFDELGAANSHLRYISFLGTLAQALGRVGQVDDGLAAIDEALDRSNRTEELWRIAEFLRIKGRLLLLRGGGVAASAADDHFRQALDWARRQGALSFELRAATSLARLLRDQGRPIDAMALLQPVYDRFTEGFDTADLKAAKALIGGLLQ